jgi:hypothetical protein
MFALNRASILLNRSQQFRHVPAAVSNSLFQYELVAGFRWKAPKTPGKGKNIHRSNQAKQGSFPS